MSRLHSVDSPSGSTTTDMLPRQKRVLPARSRRGGPGIGGSDVDMMILDMQKWKGENNPLIPLETRFLLTTDSSLVPSSPSLSLASAEPGSSRNAAKERYLDRPEVIKAYQEQELVQTPEFTLLSEDASVGGRFRPREIDDQTTDTSDAVYEKLHRKYELFEKRQRLREKEKLKHEHYKLKERIEQLRAMDSAAFLSLPAELFSPVLAPERSNEDEDEDKVAHLLGTVANGPSALHGEGERRQKEMLDLALALEERYRVLLPPDRKGTEKGSVNGSSMSVGRNSDAGGRSDGEEEEDTDEDNERAGRTQNEKIRLKIKFTPRANLLAKHGKSRLSASSLPTESVSPRASVRLSIPALPPSSQGDTSIPPDSERLTRPLKRRKLSNATEYQYDASCESVATPGPPYSSPSKSHTSYTSEPSECLLVIASKRRSSTSNPRKTQRTLTAFGVKVPAEVEANREFEIPRWVLDRDEASARLVYMLERLEVRVDDGAMSTS